MRYGGWGQSHSERLISSLSVPGSIHREPIQRSHRSVIRISIAALLPFQSSQTVPAPQIHQASRSKHRVPETRFNPSVYIHVSFPYLIHILHVSSWRVSSPRFKSIHFLTLYKFPCIFQVEIIEYLPNSYSFTPDLETSDERGSQFTILATR